MKGTIKTRMGKLSISVVWEVSEADVAKLIERSVALALPAQLQAKAAGGRIVDMAALTKTGFEARFVKRVQGDTKVMFSAPVVEAWTPAAPAKALTPAQALEQALAAIKSGSLVLSAEQAATLAAMTALADDAVDSAVDEM